MAANTHRLENWDDLRFFVAVAEQGGLSSAARILGVNQSTVFRRIAQMEEQLGARLFDRQARGYALSGVGEQVLPLALQARDDLLAFGRAVAGADRLPEGVVRLTTVLELFDCVAPHLARFQQQYPGIELQISTETRVASLSGRDADVALRPGKPPTELDVVGRRLVRAPVAVYASQTYIASRGRPTSMEALTDHPVIHFERAWELSASSHRLSVRVDSMSSKAVAARAGLGVAALPVFMGDPCAELDRLFLLPDDDAHVWLLIHADLRQTARVRALVDFMTDAIKADSAMFEGE